jgi:hypothetical protein
MAPRLRYPWLPAPAVGEVETAGLCEPGEPAPPARGGRRGGRAGGGFLPPMAGVAAAYGGGGSEGAGDAPVLPRTGGGGRCAVERPVVSLRHGLDAGGGGGFFLSASDDPCSTPREGRLGAAVGPPILLVLVLATVAGLVAPPWVPVRLGGGANEEGSRSELMGAAWWPDETCAEDLSPRLTRPFTWPLNVVPSFSGCQPCLRVSFQSGMVGATNGCVPAGSAQ